MKKYKQLVRELPSKTVVFTFGRFNPPTIGHELLIKVVRKLSSQYKADHIIFASASQDSKKNPLDVTKKVQYLELLFPNTRFVAASPATRTFLEAAVQLNKKYRNLVMVAGADRVAEFKKVLNQYNGKAFKFDTIQVVSAGERDPDADDLSGMSASKMRTLASKGDYHQFKRGLPTTVRDIDGKRLMNDIRIGMGIEPIKEQINLVKDDLREQYFRGDIFKEGDIVESNESVFKIIKRGSNHLLLQCESGEKVSKWIQDVQPTEREFMQTDLPESVSVSTVKGAGENATTQTAERAQKMAELKAKQAKQTADLKTRQDRETEQSRDALKAEAKSYNINKTVMSLHDFRKTTQMGQRGIKVDNDKETESDIDASSNATTAPSKSQVGGQHMSSVNPHDENIRRVKVGYNLGEGNGYDENRTGFAKKPREDDEGHSKPSFKAKSMMDRPHTVHVDGKKWKTFDNGHQAHKAADTLTAKGKKAVAIAHFKEETLEQQGTRVAQLKRFKDQAKQAQLGNGDPSPTAPSQFGGSGDRVSGAAVQEAVYKGLEAEDKPGKVKTAVVKTHPKAVGIDTVEGWKDEKKPVKEDLDDYIEWETEIEALAEALTDDDYLELYEDEELAIIDEETGEELEAVAEEAEYDTPALMEVLSRAERIKAKARIRRSQTKRSRAEKVAIRRFSTPQVANNRARRLTISLIKKRMLKGKSLKKASVGEKEAMERFISQRKKVVDRISARMVPRVRAVEKRRLSHGKFTKMHKAQGVAI